MLILTRAEAGRRLAVGLGALVQDVPVVVALSAGGARVASEVARALEAPLDVIAVCRLEVPARAPGAFGAVADGWVSPLGTCPSAEDIAAHLPEIEDRGSYAIPPTSLDELNVIGQLRRSRLGTGDGSAAG